LQNSAARCQLKEYFKTVYFDATFSPFSHGVVRLRSVKRAPNKKKTPCSYTFFFIENHAAVASLQVGELALNMPNPSLPQQF
jgi:hypothetical protein